SFLACAALAASCSAQRARAMARPGLSVGLGAGRLARMACTLLRATPSARSTSASVMGNPARLRGAKASSIAGSMAPVATLPRQPYVIVVNPSVPAKSVPEFIAYAKANPSRISLGSAGIGGSNHLVGELFKIMAGVDMVHVPYRGIALALNDL